MSQKLYIFLLSVSFLLVATISQAQQAEDSLQGKSYDQLQDIFYDYYDRDSLLTSKVLKTYLTRAKREKDTLHIAIGYDNYYLFREHEDGTDYINYLDSIIQYTKTNASKDYPASSYFAKAQYHLLGKRDIQKTIINLNEARKYAKTKGNIDLLYRIDYYFAIIRSEHLDEKEKALTILKKCLHYYEEKEELQYQARYLYALHLLSETYIGLKKHDSASYYNHLGYRKAKNANPNLSILKNYFTLCEGINQYEQKNYQAAIDSINIALPQMINLGDNSNIIDSYFYKGKSYYDLIEIEKAIPFFKKTDSALGSLKSTPQYKHVKTYEYLKDYYKTKNDIQNQNIYLDKLNKILDNYLNDQTFIRNKVKIDYDIQLLLEEQQSLKEALQNETKTSRSKIAWLIILSACLGGLVYFQYRKKIIYRSRFEKLVTQNQTTTPSAKKQDKKNLTANVPEKHIKHILDKLEEFEKEKKFLEPGITAQSLSDMISTNVKYLSQVINHFKSKSFTNYLNELRINYTIQELKENTMLRKFTIKAIAETVGYNNAETFSNAFYKQAKIKPSYFIKNLEKLS